MRLPNSVRDYLLRRVYAVMDRRRPDFVIGGGERPYMQRWWLIPRNRLFNVYAHRILRDDDDRALHDHPWPSCSIILRTGYHEITPEDRFWRNPGQVTARRATGLHRLEVATVGGVPIPAITLFITGPRLREWGFACPQGWVHWRAFVAEDDKGNVGRGCGEHD